MNLRQLRHFLATVEQGSLARASRKLNLSLPALSKSIQNLEATLGVTLLERGPKGMSPTVFGTALIAHAKLVHAQVDHARREIGELKGMTRGRVSFGTGPSMALAIVPAAVARMSERHPGVTIDVIEGYSETLCSALIDGAADFVLAPDLGVLPPREVRLDLLYTDHITILCRAGHPLAERPTITMRELTSVSWVLPRAPDVTRQHFDVLFQAEGLPPPTPAVETNSQALTKL
ncbi:MAG: LysR family transcriptional regulator, partial [Alphaproteobacteria bacterium]